MLAITIPPIRRGKNNHPTDRLDKILTERYVSMECKYINFSQPNAAPYSDMVVVEDRFLFLSGLVSADLETGEMINADITTETKQVLENLETVLKRYGSDMDHIIRLEIMLADFAERDEMNAEYIKHFSPAHMPARLCFGNVGLACGCKIEIMATAVRK